MKVEFTQDDVLKRGVEEVIEEKSLKNKLKLRKKLRVKFGIDPTARDIHLGHTVMLWKLRQFQDLGHKIILIIGDFTATIGDPSGQTEERKVLTEKEVKQNMKRYREQIGKILDTKKAEIHYNSEWHKKEGLEAALQLARTASLQQLTKRSDFAERIKKGSDITFIELFYPLLQGYDSVKVKADVEIGGTDQKFNLLMGRQVQKRYGQEPQDVMTLPLLLGTDGVRKMSKSFDNYIALEDNPADMFGKIMSIQDKEIVQYFELATPLQFKTIQGLKKQKITGKKARDLKLQLAQTITALYHSDSAAQKAHEEFLSIFKLHKTSENILEFISTKSATLAELLVEVGFAPTKTEARRLIEQGGVYVDDKRVEDTIAQIPKKPFVLRVGRRKIAQIK